MAQGASELIVFRTFRSRIDAELARSALEASGIWCLIRGDEPRGYGYRDPFSEPIGVMVRSQDHAAALDVLGPERVDG